MEKSEVEKEFEKIRLECEKLALEIAQMKKPWWKKVTVWAIILPTTIGLVTFYYDVRQDKAIKKSEELHSYKDMVKAIGTADEIKTEEEKSAITRKENLEKYLIEFGKK